MKRFHYAVVCLLCAAAGVGAGRYLWPAPVSDAPVIGSSSHRTASQKPAGLTTEKALAAVRSGPRRAALMLAMAARGERNKLPALIAACGNDPATLQLLADLWLTIDPAAFVDALAESPAMKGAAREQAAVLLIEVFTRWSETDRDSAWHSAESLHGSLRRFMLGQLAGVLVRRDPRAGLEFILHHPGVAPVSEGISSKEAPALLDLIQQLPGTATKRHMLVDALKTKPLAEAVTLLGEAGDAVSAIAGRTLLSGAAKKSVEDVIAFHAQALGATRYAAAQSVGRVLITKDPAAAITWAQENLSGFDRSYTIREAAQALQSKDPTAAAAARALLPESFRQNSPAGN